MKFSNSSIILAIATLTRSALGSESFAVRNVCCYNPAPKFVPEGSIVYHKGKKSFEVFDKDLKSKYKMKMGLKTIKMEVVSKPNQAEYTFKDTSTAEQKKILSFHADWADSAQLRFDFRMLYLRLTCPDLFNKGGKETQRGTRPRKDTVVPPQQLADSSDLRKTGTDNFMAIVSEKSCSKIVEEEVEVGDMKSATTSDDAFEEKCDYIVTTKDGTGSTEEKYSYFESILVRDVRFVTNDYDGGCYCFGHDGGRSKATVKLDQTTKELIVEFPFNKIVTIALDPKLVGKRDWQSKSQYYKGNRYQSFVFRTFEKGSVQATKLEFMMNSKDQVHVDFTKAIKGIRLDGRTKSGIDENAVYGIVIGKALQAAIPFDDESNDSSEDDQHGVNKALAELYKD